MRSIYVQAGLTKKRTSETNSNCHGQAHGSYAGNGRIEKHSITMDEQNYFVEFFVGDHPMFWK